MPSPRKPKPRKAEQHELDEFAERYETFAIIYGDPIETVFEIMAKEDQDDEVRLQAAKLLMEHRYPKLKALEGAGPPAQAVQINISLVKPPQVTAIDVTPVPPQLEAVG